MWKRAILPVLINLEMPNDGCKKNDRGLNEEVSLLLNPRTVQVKLNCISTLVSI